MLFREITRKVFLFCLDLLVRRRGKAISLQLQHRYSPHGLNLSPFFFLFSFIFIAESASFVDYDGTASRCTPTIDKFSHSTVLNHAQDKKHTS